MNLHLKQKQIVRSNARFKVVKAGRRGGKTTLEIEDMIFEATSGNDRPIFYIAPTQKQARDIIWESLKTRLAGIGQANESRLEMKVPTVDGGYSIIYVSGWENRENFRGKKSWKQYFDELDTMKDFFVGWQEIFRPALTDYAGHAMFSGTPNNKNPNLKRLEKLAEKDTDYAVFTFKSADNPHLPPEEIEKARLELDPQSFRQEYEAEYATEVGSLFAYSNVLDVFTNTIDKTSDKYLIVDVAGEGTDKTKFSRWEGLEEVSRETFSHLTQEQIIHKIRDYCALYQIPMSHVAVDSIGIGEGIASNSMLRGIVGFKSSYSAIKTEKTIVQLQNVHYIKEPPLISDYTNLRSQCIFKLANLVYNHKIASKVTGDAMENILEELPLYQDISLDSNKRQATGKEDIKGLLGRSPDDSDTWIMRMYFEIVDSVNPITEEHKEASNKQLEQFRKNFNNIRNYSTK